MKKTTTTTTQFIQFGLILEYLTTTVGVGFCANVLIADVMPSPSHQIFNYAIAEGLLEKGHNVTMLGPSSSKSIVHENFHHLSLEGLFASVMKDFDAHAFGDMYKIEMVLFYHDYSFSACKHSLLSKGFKDLMNYPQDFKFDIILFDLTIGSCFLPLIKRFNYPPAIGITAFQIPAYLSFDFGNELCLSYVPSFYTPYSTEMTFFQRLENYIATYTHIISRDIYLNRSMMKLLREAFNDTVESLRDLENHVSLLLANWNPILNHPQSVTPNIVPIGGAHIRLKKLPKDIQDIMDHALDGVILFSLGTNVRSDQFSVSQRRTILNTFAKLKETVLWKFESNITGLPKNVIVRKWLPQNEILAHPNLKLFISHSGGLSTVEASYFGVPMLGMPFFIDQHLNIDNLVRKGVARKMEVADLTESVFFENINRLLHSDKYKKNMQELSRKIRDEPQTPMERALFWIEYAIRYNGTHFLNPKSRNLPTFITSSSDIHLFFIFVFCLLVYISRTIYQILNKTVNKIIPKSKNE